MPVLLMIGFMGDFYHIRTFSYEQIIYMYLNCENK